MIDYYPFQYGLEMFFYHQEMDLNQSKASMPAAYVVENFLVAQNAY